VSSRDASIVIADSQIGRNFKFYLKYCNSGQFRLVRKLIYLIQTFLLNRGFQKIDAA